jgi:asparagine synthase (glutamine-hydrolysing)
VADLLPQSVVQRVKSGYPSIQDPAYGNAMRTQVAALLNDRNAVVAPLLSVEKSRALLNTTDDTWWLEYVVALQGFLTDYNVSLAL